MGKQHTSLRSLIESSRICEKKFKEAESLAKYIFSKCTRLPFYTEHGNKHCEMLENYLNQIIWRNGKPPHEYDFIPSPEEAMYLLSAVWLHDIGMWYKIFDNEKPENLKDVDYVINLRDDHHWRSAKYINEKWQAHNWSDGEKHYLSNTCAYHRRYLSINDFDPYKIKSRHTAEKVRLAVLAALLRLADACHVDKTRAPAVVMDRYISVGMPRAAANHWKRAELIQEVSFNHADIVVTGHYPREIPFDFGDFDLREVGEIICQDLAEELHSVQQILRNFANTAFSKIKNDYHYMDALEPERKRRCLDLWPYLLGKPFSATEAAAALAKMVLIATEYGTENNNLGTTWRGNVSYIMNKLVKLRPADLMLRNLRKEVKEIVKKLPREATSASKLKGYLKRFMKKLKNNCEKVAGHALEIIKPGDALLIYGYSTSIERLLNKLDKEHPLYVVECYRPIGEDPRFNENERILKLIKNLGYSDVSFLQLQSLAQTLEKIQGKKRKPCKLILGTHGVLRNGDLLCKVGSYTLATTAAEFDVEVIAFAEGMKLLKSGVSNATIARRGKFYSSTTLEWPPGIRINYITPAMDRVPRSFVNIVVNEKRAYATA